MSSQALETLISRLDAAPDNVLLRLAVIRRARADGGDSRALSLAFALDAQAVTGEDDRRMLAELFGSAGLDEEAALWASDQISPDEDDPEDISEDIPAQPFPPSNVVPLHQETDPVADEDARPRTFGDVGGLQQVKKDIERRIIAPFKQAGLIARFRKRSGGGVLMYGPPGCGKTLIARATAGECGARFQSVPISDILDPYVGVSEQKLSEIFRTARALGPTVLFFDEIDALAMKRNGDTAAHVNRLASHFLAEMDGAGARNNGVLVLAATNTPWTMDAAFLRPGRFDRLFFVPPPDTLARTAILKLELAERPAVAGLRLDQVTAATAGFSGADLAMIVESATDLAIDASLAKGREVPIDQTMLDEAARRVRPSTLDWLTTARNHATYGDESGRYDDVLAFLKQHGRA